MMGILITWVCSALALYAVTKIMPGVTVSSIEVAFLAALVIGLVNATLGLLLKILTLPIGCLTLGLSSLVINALMFLVAANFVNGFHVTGFIPALLGSIVMSLVSAGLHMLLGSMMSNEKN